MTSTPPAVTPTTTGVTGVFKLIFQLLFCAIELKFLFDEYLAAKELGFEVSG